MHASYLSAIGDTLSRLPGCFCRRREYYIRVSVALRTVRFACTGRIVIWIVRGFCSKPVLGARRLCASAGHLISVRH